MVICYGFLSGLFASAVSGGLMFWYLIEQGASPRIAAISTLSGALFAWCLYAYRLSWQPCDCPPCLRRRNPDDDTTPRPDRDG